MTPHLLHVVLFQPEIPPNTGNVARMCACTGCHLHLIHPLGFDISDRMLKRAGLDYWPHVSIQEWPSWQDFAASGVVQGRLFGLTTHASRTIWECRFQPGDALVFGPETRGLPSEVLAQTKATRIPMRNDAPVRSLNLSSACAIATYEALRQILAPFPQ